MTRHDMACTPYGDEDGRYDIADPRILSWGTEPETDSEEEHSIGLKRQ